MENSKPKRKLRPTSPGDFDFDVEGVGRFVYARRTIGDQIKIRRRFIELCDGQMDDPELSFFAGIAAAHEVLCVTCPEGWEDLIALDMNSPERNISKVIALDKALADKEDSFRGAP